MFDLIKKFGAFSVGPVMSAFIGFITVPLITFFISPDEYGKSSMFVVAQGTISMLVYLGMDQAFVREFNLHKECRDMLMSNALCIPFIFVMSLSIVIAFFNKPVSTLLFGTSNETVAVFSLAVMMPFMVIEHFTLFNIRMEEKGLQYSFFTILLKALTLLFTIILFFTYEKSFRSVVFAIAIAEIMNGILLYAVSLRNLKISLKKINRTLMVRMLKYGLPLIPAAMLGWALTSMDKIMLRSLCSYSELGLYSAAFKIANVLGIIQSCFTLFWVPVAYRWYESGRPKSDFEGVSKLVTTTMTGVCLVILLAKDLVAFILGDEFESARYIFPFLLLQPIMYTISETTAVGIGFTRNTSYNILVSAISGGSNILLNYIMIPVLDGKGAALATGISYMVFFWARTIISGKLWHRFKLTPYICYSIIIVINCIVHTFMSGFIPYVVTILSIVIIMTLNIRVISKIISVCLNLTKNM